MKRDMELIRKIILEVEKAQDNPIHLKIENYSDEEIGYHVYLLIQGGLVEGIEFPKTFESTLPTATPTNLTWNGYEFAVAIRNESIWNKAMEIGKKKGDPITIGVLIELISSIVKKFSGLP